MNLTHEAQFSVIGCDHPGQDLHERRLAGPVVSDESQNFTTVQLKRCTPDCLHMAIGLADVPRLDHDGHQDCPALRTSNAVTAAPPTDFTIEESPNVLL